MLVFLWRPNIECSDHKSLWMDTALNFLNLVHTLKPCLSKIISDIFLLFTSGSTKFSFYFRFKFCVNLYHVFFVLHTCQTFWFDYPNNISSIDLQYDIPNANELNYIVMSVICINISAAVGSFCMETSLSVCNRGINQCHVALTVVPLCSPVMPVCFVMDFESLLHVVVLVGCVLR